MVTSAINEHTELEIYLKVEKDYIDEAKYYEGIKIKSDPGQSFIINWIQGYADDFRIKWNCSMCRLCTSALNCGHYLKTDCDYYKEKKYVN